jgi:hypothetical protein
MEWSETMRELRGEKQDVFARQRTRSNCRLYAARGGERHCQVIPCLFLQGTNHETDKQTMKLQAMIRGGGNENQKETCDDTKAEDGWRGSDGKRKEQ